jgi:hypothetical protein
VQQVEVDVAVHGERLEHRQSRRGQPGQPEHRQALGQRDEAGLLAQPLARRG